MYEHHKQPLVPRKVFYRRIFTHVFMASLLMLVCLLIGILGYHTWGALSWLDSLHNAAMILGGMGLVDPVHSTAGKIFSSAYALFSGVIFITNFGIILAPAAHRLFHKLHLEDK